MTKKMRVSIYHRTDALAALDRRPFLGNDAFEMMILVQATKIICGDKVGE